MMDNILFCLNICAIAKVSAREDNSLKKIILIEEGNTSAKTGAIVYDKIARQSELKEYTCRFYSCRKF